ncbi:DUF4197 domain-containing protein [Coraliomargarita algicola]|uniref:DUF4197 domain-containing protein n=1 Tax=Coraliomargarita algicola TaxID=3092156 RepID=A0ABZ0RS06_9BACT|nr:DUF4197 domain-containing protein [Coraliomargarita sp. J2-16]WPJ97687.1 DUF4197 domain-containing protein [Coraliomargarita sp. J2-16]
MRSIQNTLLVALTVLLSTGALRAESSWASRALSIFKSSPAADTELGSAFANADELAKALREALAVSAERALTALGQQGGFANSELYQIPLPRAVEKLRKPLALINQDYRLDDVQATINRAAEAGVAAAPAIVKEAINSLTLEDLNTLWKGEDDAITRFLEKKSRAQLSERMLPLISQATDATGATRAYKEMQSAVPSSGTGLFSKIQSFTGIAASDFDLDQYVNDQALDGLFTAMAAEEKAIRENPLARSTDLLKQLFGQ